MRNIIDGNLPTTASTPSARVISYQRVQISYSCVSKVSDLDLCSVFYIHTHTHTHTPHFLTRTLTKQTLSLNVQHKRDRSSILIPTFPLLFTYFYCLPTVICTSTLTSVYSFVTKIRHIWIDFFCHTTNIRIKHVRNNRTPTLLCKYCLFLTASCFR